MTRQEMTENSLRIERIIMAPPGKVWEAIAEKDRLIRWFCPGTRTCEVDQWDFRENGAYRLAFVPTEDDGFGGPSPAHGVFQRIVPEQEVAMSWKWDFPDEDHNEPESRLILRLEKTDEGTKVALIHEGLPNRQSVEGHYGGWMTVLPKLEAVFS